MAEHKSDRIRAIPAILLSELCDGVFTKKHHDHCLLRCHESQCIVSSFLIHSHVVQIDDFYVPIGKFVSNMSSGTSIDNERFIRSLEPVLLASLDYNLVVYLPYRYATTSYNVMKFSESILSALFASRRPLDGHLLMAKALLPQERQTLDVLRSGAYRFLENVCCCAQLLARIHCDCR